MTTTPDIPMLREVLDRGDDPTTIVPLGNLVDLMIEVGMIQKSGEGPATARAVRAALLDGVCTGDGDEPSVLIAMSWTVELLENLELAPRLIRSSPELFVETIQAIRQAAGLA